MSKMPTEREQPGRGRLGHAVVVRGRDEVGADQPVGGRAADREGAGEQPERPVTRASPSDRSARPAGLGARRRARSGVPRAVRRAGRGRPGGRAGAPATSGRRAARRPRPRATPSASPCVLPARASSGRKISWPVAPAAVSTPKTRPRRVDEPAAADRRREHGGHRAGAEPDDHAPAAVQLPRRVIQTVSTDPRRRTAARRHHPADPEPVHQRRGERPGQAEQDQVDRDGAEIVRSQPNSSCSGTMSTPGVDRKPGRAEQREEATAATTQAGCGPRRRCVMPTGARTSGSRQRAYGE